MISLDSETTGLSFTHGARPFFVTVCHEEGTQHYWDWQVDPLTREVTIPLEDIKAIQRILNVAKGWGKFDKETQERHVLVGQNSKFDASALVSIGIEDWPWSMTRDTLLAGHLLASNRPHNLTDMAIQYLGVDIEPLEKKLKEACDKARRQCRSKHPDWMIAREGLACMPSAKGECWKFDTWLPKTLIRHTWENSESCKLWVGRGFQVTEAVALADGWEAHPAEVWEEDVHPWWTVLQEYANSDSAATLALWKVMREQICQRGLWAIYLERLKLLPISHRMEQRGITISKPRLRQLRKEYGEASEQEANTCGCIAKEHGYDLHLPKSGNNQSLLTFCFGISEEGESYLDLPKIVSTKSKTGNPSLDKAAIEEMETRLEPGSSQDKFVKALKGKRKRDTALSFLESYEKFMLPLNRGNFDWRLKPTAIRSKLLDLAKMKEDIPDSMLHDALCEAGQEDVAARSFLKVMQQSEWHLLHPNTNPTGTDTLRWSTNNPNSTQISKQGMFEGDKHTLRWCFGPAPGREWWSMDYENNELRIPAYESGEQCMIELFEKPNDPPYFGSVHLLNAGIVYPDLFWPLAETKGAFKEKYAATWYQWIKNAGFALQYGCQEAKFDSTAHKKGGYALLKSRLKEHSKLVEKWIKFADKHGYVETMPDKTVDPTKGYPLLCTRTEYGKILPTVPLSYHVQSTAMQCTNKAMIRCQDQLDAWRDEDGFDGHIALQVHDELVFDLPRSPDKGNLPRVRILQQLMSQSGDDIGVPLPVAVTHNPSSWSEGEKP